MKKNVLSNSVSSWDILLADAFFPHFVRPNILMTRFVAAIFKVKGLYLMQISENSHRVQGNCIFSFHLSLVMRGVASLLSENVKLENLPCIKYLVR